MSYIGKYALNEMINWTPILAAGVLIVVARCASPEN